MKDNSKLIPAFRDTRYLVICDKIASEPLVLRIDHQLPPELIAYYPQLTSWCFITAWNPLPEILSDSENHKRNRTLQDHLDQLDLEYLYGYGESADQKWREDSFWVMNISREKAQELGAQYGQLAIVYGEKDGVAELVMLSQ